MDRHKPRYVMTGVDIRNDVHRFETDDPDRGLDVLEKMRGTLTEVTLRDRVSMAERGRT